MKTKKLEDNLPSKLFAFKKTKNDKSVFTKKEKKKERRE